MKSFDDIETTQEEATPQIIDKYYHQKQKLLFNVTRSKEVCDALSAWLTSFEGGISKEAFMDQLKKLSFDDSEAVGQILRSKGRRAIVKQKKFMLPLPPIDSVLTLLASGTLFIAVNGRDAEVRSFVHDTYRTLKALGKTVVLDLDELRLEWTDKYTKGNSSRLLQDAKESDFLIIVGFEVPQDLSRFIGDALGSLRRYRIERKLPMIMPFARTWESTRLLDGFKKFSLRGFNR